MPLLPSDDSIYRISLIFFINLCPHAIPQSDSVKLYTIFSEVPYLPLICENYINMLNYIQSMPYFKNMPKPPSRSNDKSAQPLIETIKKNFSDISFKIWQICSSVNSSNSMSTSKYPQEEIIQIISEAINLISSTTNMLKEQYVEKLSNPPPEPRTMTKYERSIRYGYQNQTTAPIKSKKEREMKKDNEMKTMLQLLALCKQLHDLMKTNLPFIYERVCESINYIFDEFISNGLEYVIKHAKHEKKSVENLIEKLRSLYGNYKGNKDVTLTPQSSGNQSPSSSSRKKTRSQQRSSVKLDISADSPLKSRRKTLHLASNQIDLNDEINMSSEIIKRETLSINYDEIFTKLSQSENQINIKLSNPNIKNSLVAPPIELIKLIRIQISHILKPENDFQCTINGKV